MDDTKVSRPGRPSVKMSIDEYIKSFDLGSDEEMADLLGYHKSAISNWRKAGRVPTVVSVALEGLVRRRRQQSPNDVVLVIVHIPRGQVDLLTGIVQQLKGTCQILPLS